MDAAALGGVVLMFIGAGLMGRSAIVGGAWSFVTSVGVLALGLLLVLLTAAIQKGVL